MAEKEFEELMKHFPPDIFSAEFTDKALKHFKDLHHKSLSGTPDEQEEAKLELASYEIERVKMRKELSNISGIEASEIQRILCNEQNYDQDDWNRLKEATEEMIPIVEDIPKKKKKGKSKTKKGWVKS
ncbi:MAG: hypothetical protein P0S95_02090 [Rhabdochlamydiaceae bacterium]|nr:hypothetical protein [Candidatus Amphrikana amoebophyrae]